PGCFTLRHRLCVPGPDEANGSHDASAEQRQYHSRGGDYRTAPPPQELARAIGKARRRCRNRFVPAHPFEVECKLARTLVAAARILLERMHHHPVQLARKGVAVRTSSRPRASIERTCGGIAS